MLNILLLYPRFPKSFWSFDGEKAGAGNRIVQFVEQSTIPIAFFSMLQTLPDTALCALCVSAV